MAITKTQRWLDLIALLVKRRFPVDVEEIMRGVPAYAAKWASEEPKDRDAVRRMFERDKDELRAAGIPLETVEYSIEHGMEEAIGYRIASKDFYLPYLRIVGGGAETGGTGATPRPRRPGGTPGTGAMELEISAEHAALAMDALRRVAELPESPFAEEAHSALAKLRFDLDSPVVGEAAPVLYADAAGTGGVRETLRLLTDALRRRKRVRFRYHGIHRGEATERDVAPYALLYQHGHWYLIGSDAARDGAIRVFRLGRVEDPAVGKGDTPEYEPDPAFDVSAYARRAPWELGDDAPLTANVRFEFPLSLWAERNAHGDPVGEEAGGAVVRRFEVRQTDPFLRWLQSFAGDAVVVEPPELRRAQAEMARETLASYGGGPEASPSRGDGA